MISNERASGNSSFSSVYKLETTASIYNAPSILLQGKSSANLYMVFTGSKELIANKLTISAAINNPFVKFLDTRTTIQGTNSYQTSNRFSYHRSFSASLNWKFGKLKSSMKKNKRSINNDDKVTSGTSVN